MGNKHDILTEEELSSYTVSSKVLQKLEALKQNFPAIAPAETNILDWGCGRGRSVAKLREMGYNAYGVDIDVKTLKNGYPLFRSRGYSPEKTLLPIESLMHFPEGFFHLVFSEQVFEHVENLSEAIHMQGKLTAGNGMGIHV